jgi:hypothetical protein
MSDLGDIITAHREAKRAEARWNGTESTLRVAREVPAEVDHAIEAFEAARRRRQEWNKHYIETRWQHALDRCQVNDRLAGWWWQRLGDLLPKEAGWYPHDGRIYGWAKQDKGGFELTRRSGWSAWPNEAEAAAWERSQVERERARRQLEAFCTQTRGALK